MHCTIPRCKDYLLILFAGISLILSAHSADAAAIIEGERMHPVQWANGMVVTSHFLATQAALEVLEKDGNDIDAAVTAAFSLAVTQPRSGNIGGGFMLISSEQDNDVVAIETTGKRLLPGQPSTCFSDSTV